MPTTPGIFFQHLPDGMPVRLEMYLLIRESSEFHFYVQNVPYADLAALVAPELRPLQALIFRIPPILLNPNYWQPYSHEAESAVRDKMTGVITRQTSGGLELWRSDSITPGRYLRDNVDVPEDLILGYVIKTTGEGLLKLGTAWAESDRSSKDRFQWIAYRSLPNGSELRNAVLNGHNDMTAFRLSSPAARFAFAASGDGRMRLILPSRDLLRRAVRAALRGYLMRISGQTVSPPNDTVCEQVIRLAEGRGLSSIPERDFVNKIKTFEFTAHPGRTEWGLPDRLPDRDRPAEEKILVYYDRVAGLWAVAG